MFVEDLRQIEVGSRIDADLCIVGSGPAGWTVAEELQDSGLRLLMLESGGLTPHASASSLNTFQNTGVPSNSARERVLGGTSHIWTNRCIPLDPIDYEARPWVPHSGWPFGAEDMLPFVNRAAEHINVGPFDAEGRGPAAQAMLVSPPVDTALLSYTSWEFPQPAFHAGQRLVANRNPALRAIVNATVTQINIPPSGTRLESLEVTDLDGVQHTIKARAVVLCTGGIENARILLYSNRLVPFGIGNSHDVVGRYFMDHPRDLGMAVRFDLQNAAPIKAVFGPHFLRSPRGGMHEFFRGLTFSSERQRREERLNCAAWPIVNYADTDPLKSLRRLHRKLSQTPLDDARMVLTQPGTIARAAWAHIFHGENLAHHHRVGQIGFVIGSEQMPDPDSRVQLGEDRDRFGLPTAKLHWKVHDREKADQAELALTIAREFQRIGLPEPILADWVRTGRYDDAPMQDGSHPIGSTRMSVDPRLGVVDANSQVHGVDGLFITGSSVFPTAGHANPTLMIVALAVRLAQHLKRTLALPDSPSRPVDSSPPSLAGTVRRPLPHLTAGPEAAGEPRRSKAAVTGATGFIGRRLVERLIEAEWDVTCLLRSEQGAQRLRDQGAQVSILDLADVTATTAALAGVDVIFHGAYDWNDHEWNRAALLSLVAGCRVQQCSRLVHLSSFVVYKTPAVGELTEEAAKTDSSSGYAHMKRELEAVITKAVRETGLPAVILEPTIVYGPYSKPWTIDPADMLRFGAVVLPDGGEGLCNAVHVDDVVQAMRLAAHVADAIGERFLISGPEPITWAEFYSGIARAAGVRGPVFRPASAILRESEAAKKALRFITSPERIVRRLVQVQPVGKLTRAAMRFLPAASRGEFEDSLFGPNTRRRGFVHLPNVDFLERRAVVTSEKARRVVGYRPKVKFQDALPELATFLRQEQM